MATLFSYFGKSAKAASKKKETQSKSENVIDGKSSPDTIPRVKTKLEKSFLIKSDWIIGDIVWAKLEGYPWWPSLICQHPGKKLHKKNDSDTSLYHVQFFGEPPTRAWIQEINVASFDKAPQGAKEKKEILPALKQAEAAALLSSEERISQYYACIPSDEEMEQAAEDDDEDEEDALGRRKAKRSKSLRSSSECESRLKRKRVKMSIESDESDASEDDDEQSDYKPDESESSDEESSGAEEENLNVSDEENDGVGKRKRKWTGAASSKSKQKKPCPAEEKTPLAERINNSSFSTPKSKVSTSLSSKLSNSISKAQSTLSKFSASSPASGPPVEDDGVVYVHETLKFLHDGHRKDKHGRLHTDSDYDPRTLLVPANFLNSKDVSPGLRQWWKMKIDHFDTILFFKVGKFYELYHMDAVVGVRELGLLFMKGKFAHCGFPEIAFSRYSETLVQKGYKVARVEQTETPQAMNERKAGDKVVNREICAVISKGTRTFSFMEGQTAESEAAYLLAIVERASDAHAAGGSMFGVCFVDTSIGKFHLGQFSDDRQCSRLRTMIAHHPPVQVLYERHGLSQNLQHVLSHELLATIKEPLAAGAEFWDAGKTLRTLKDSEYFTSKKEKKSHDLTAESSWPGTLKKMLSEGDNLGLTASNEYELAVSSLGACVWYLRKCCIEEELLSMGQFEEYVPVDSKAPKRVSDFPEKHQKLILDGVSLLNLDVTANGDGTQEGTLLQLLDHCCTAFGARLFKQWVCSPLCSVDAINNRLSAVDDLMKNASLLEKARELMKTIPDVERLLRRIHSLGSLKRSSSHPDSRAVFYNEEVYSKRKISDLLAALDAFEKGKLLLELFQDDVADFSSSLLRQILTLKQDGDDGKFPDVSKFLQFFKGAFDHNKAKNEGTILPKPGVHEDYDAALAEIKRLKESFESYMEEQRKRLGCRNLSYWGTGKTRYQLEVPDSALTRSTPDDYHLKSQRKGFRRFYTDEIESMLQQLVDAEESRDSALKDTMRNIFAKFDKDYKSWEAATQCLATLDCLMSLAHYSLNIDGGSCRPEIVPPYGRDGSEVQPFIEILNSRHPCMSRTFSGGDFIPNDIVVGKADDGCAVGPFSSCLLVTGPNMGGKSTLMRQAGVLIIMAQLGCYVPAEVCRFTPVDRIFTRLGAHDRILHGESTFFVELSETSTILHHATRHSLVLLDELGRGTATYDGTAIATAVLWELAHSIRCRTLFSTHYHTLVDDFASDKLVKLGHMSCMVEKDGEDEDDPSKETITFLYKFAKGDCPKSYGFNAAKLAGIPDSVIKSAHRRARDFEETARNIRLFRSLLRGNAFGSVCSLRKLLQIAFP